jgi:hypothetical protein
VDTRAFRRISNRIEQNGLSDAPKPYQQLAFGPSPSAKALD